jgi:lipoprotein LprG
VIRPLSRISLVAAALLLAGCTGGEEGNDDPQAALERAAEVLTEARSVRVSLSGDDLPDDGTVVLRAEGTAAPPASFEGEIRIKAGALPATIDVVSVDGQLWAQLPLTDGFAEVDPDELGFGDPGRLIDPEQGVSQLLTSGENVSSAGQERVDGEVYDQIEATLPGELVDHVLALADPSADVAATWSVHPDTGELRQAELTGPFYDDGEATYTVELDRYDEPVEIRAPN